MVVFILCSKAFQFQADLYLVDEGEQNQRNMIQPPCVADELQLNLTLFISFYLELHLLHNISSVEKNTKAVMVFDLPMRRPPQNDPEMQTPHFLTAVIQSLCKHCETEVISDDDFLNDDETCELDNTKTSIRTNRDAQIEPI